jgi:Mn2+/Fe2+ NRAMP family transporter
VLNDLGEPDFDGHRKSYLRLIEAEKIMQEYKNEMTKRIIGWILAAVLGAMSSGLITWLKDHLK